MLRSLSRARPPLRAPTCTRAATYPAHYYNYKSPNDIPIRTNLRGSELLNTPAVTTHHSAPGDTPKANEQLNKGAGFSREERAVFGLEGFLPYDVHSLERQALRAYNQLKKQPSVIQQHAFLASLRDQNQVLFYRLMQDHLKELLGVLYTPGAAQAVAQYSNLFRRPIGCFLSYPNKDGMRAQLLAHLHDINRVADVAMASEDPKETIDLVVVTDAEAILGIGDQGVGGITISTSKSALYTLGAGINPNRILPVMLDVGTNNHALFSDPLYMGWKRTRLRGKVYDDFVDQFVQTCREIFPKAVIHFEDFGMANAYRFMQKYQNQMPFFNDDIQGTGAVTLAALISALKVIKSPLEDQRIVIYGAGSAGMGIANQILDGLMILGGLSREEALKRFCQIAFARPDSDIADWKLENPELPNEAQLIDVVRHVKPTVLIGTSTSRCAFDEEVVKTMYEGTKENGGSGRPIIFPLSNPTELCEVDPIDALNWTDGNALIATGSPFPPVPMPDGKEALGLGAILSGAKVISPAMLMAAVHALASQSPALRDENAALLPDLSDVRTVSVPIASGVIKQAIDEGVATDEEAIKTAKEKSEKDLQKMIADNMWNPVYRPLELVD
ncbi:malate dehydrogenase [Trichosporon asahii var. asahii CBS 8904]|uniref:Malic enzyme n=1 Tax=Trichosporon asahii var. asahii (strain CBS 8904) TaxID=1220162 RepID=K1VI96_TRIAC|nr:malate dehydrogenase [Trichosporon asahii var. asahii CBS 8904]